MAGNSASGANLNENTTDEDCDDQNNSNFHSDSENQSEMNADSELDESGALEGMGVLDVLRYLLQGRSYSSEGASSLAQARRLRLHYDDDSESSEDEATRYLATFNTNRRRSNRIPRPPDRPDTSVIDQSELKQQYLYESGCLNPFGKKLKSSLAHTPTLLPLKETGLYMRTQNMSPGQRVMASCHYLPNKYHSKIIHKVNEKFFCGIYNKQGDLFMSACQDARIRLFDTNYGKWVKLKSIQCKDVGWSILDVDFSHGGNHIIYSSWSEYVHLCNIRGENEVHEALYLAPSDIARTAIFSLRFTPDDSEILAGANNGDIYVYDRERKKRILTLDAHEDDLSSVAFADESGHIFYSGGEDGVVKVWDRRNLCEHNPTPVGELAGHYDSIVHIDSKNDSRYLLTNSKDQSIKLWDIRNFASQRGIQATRRAVSNQQWDYRWHNYSGKIVKKKLEGDCSLMTYYGHSVARTLIRARFSPAFTTGQKYIYCGDGLGRVVMYDLLTGQQAEILERPDPKCGHLMDVVRDASWHPYENNIVSSGWDGRLIMWEHGANPEYEAAPEDEDIF